MVKIGNSYLEKLGKIFFKKSILSVIDHLKNGLIMSFLI